MQSLLNSVAGASAAVEIAERSGNFVPIGVVSHLHKCDTLTIIANAQFNAALSGIIVLLTIDNLKLICVCGLVGSLQPFSWVDK